MNESSPLSSPNHVHVYRTVASESVPKEEKTLCEGMPRILQLEAFLSA